MDFYSCIHLLVFVVAWMQDLYPNGQKLSEGGSNESDLLLQDQKFVNETSYVIQLFHALGYDDVSKTVIETICNLI